ncbi:hypothetical protein B296_00008715 [Ensete ventricosum]|uniref:Uncharacterized protein n=1 Tax=Ensete ventricosum TaxID=4639 RepID=A0A427AJ93_ENSVE|nr:hypothetical protein B296_00008715 [Ensete ventricosum]
MYIVAPSSSYCSRTLTATDATFSHEVAPQSQPTLLLPYSSFIVVATFRLRSLGCHLPTNISHQKNRSLDDIAASTLQHHRMTATDEEVKVRQSYTLKTVISFTRHQEERLNYEARKTRVAPRPAAPKLSPSPTVTDPAMMQCSLISGYFHDFIEERIMMLKVFPNDDLGSTVYDC